MKYISMLLLFIFSSINLQAQDTIYIKSNHEEMEYKIDTMIVDSPFKLDYLLYGTKILPNTSSQQIVKGHGLFLDSVGIEHKSKECFLGDNEILFVDIQEKKLSIRVNVWENSCHNFLCDVEILEDNTLNLISHAYGMNCSCYTNHLLTYVFDRKEWGDITELKYVSINGKKRVPLRNMNNIVTFYIKSWFLSSNPTTEFGDAPLFFIDGVPLDKANFTENDIDRIIDMKISKENNYKSNIPIKIMVRTK